MEVWQILYLEMSHILPYVLEERVGVKTVEFKIHHLIILALYNFLSLFRFFIVKSKQLNRLLTDSNI